MLALEPTQEIQTNAFVCDCKEEMRTACVGEGYFKDHGGKHYCVLHYPSKEKAEAFKEVLEKKVRSNDFDFRGAWFPDHVNFADVYFSANAYFGGAIFSADAEFGGATFSADADFIDAIFSAYAGFVESTFSADAKFFKATFSANANFFAAAFNVDANFGRATFSADAYFGSAAFSDISYFGSAAFNGNADFVGAAFSGNANFGSAAFSVNANFGSASFSGNAYFVEATFSADADFKNADFNADADFKDADFSANADFFGATFSADANFSKATFSAETNLSYATFSAIANFSKATFSADADFGHATFKAVANFESATFKDYVYFVGSSGKRTLGDHPQLDFQFALFEKPDRVWFHTLDLQPHWFINVDSRKFAFTDAEFKYDLKEEIKFLEEATDTEFKYNLNRLLAISCRQLAVNAEENHRYREASRLRYSSFDVRRIERYYGFVPWRLDWWYWLASGYGESVSRAFIVFFVLISLFAFGYTRVGFEQSDGAPPTSVAQMSSASPNLKGKPLGVLNAIIYSAYVSILQKPDPKPLTPAAKSLVWMETVLGPAQAALLALAVRRRFMR
jgi:pentapeptide repeat protein